MKRKLSLLMAVIMILGSFSFAFAANDEVDVPEFLKEEGILVGGTDGDLMLEKNLTREEAVVLLSRLLKEEDAAKEFEVTEELPSFKDTKDIDPFWKPYIAWAEANEYFKGHTGEREGEFGFKDNLTARQYAVVLLRALGYVEEADNWDEAYETAVELGLLENVEAEKDEEIVREIAAQMTFNALGTNLKDSEETLADKLEIEMPVVTPDELEVVEVKADNLKEVVVTFNQEVDAATVTDANVSVKGVKGSAALAEDGVTVVVTVNGVLDNQKAYKLVAKNVKSVDGAEIAETEVDFDAFDATLPEVKDIVVTGPRTFELVFSEPIAKAGTLEIKQDKTKVGHKVNVDENGSRRVSVEVYTNLQEGKEYEVTVTGFEDFAEYKNVVNTLKFTYEKDVNPPVAEVVKAEQTYVVVDFNKPVKGLKADKFYHTFNAWSAVGIYKDAEFETKVEDADSVTRVYVLFHDANAATTEDKAKNKALPEGDVRFGINGDKIVDNWGNALGQFETTVKVSADKVVPEVTEIEVVTEKQLKIKFNKNVSKPTVDVLDENGNKIDGLTWNVDGSGKEYKVNLSKNMSGKVVTVVVKDVVDTTLLENKMAAHTELVEITDKTAPEVLKVYHDTEVKTKDGKDVYSGKLVVIFSEDVDGDTALNAKSYALVYKGLKDNKKVDKVMPLTETPGYDLNSSRVVIPLTSAQAEIIFNAGSEEDVKLQVIGVKDLAGNTIAPTVHPLDEELDKVNTVGAKATAVARDKIVVELNDLVNKVNKKQFKLEVPKNENYTDYEINQIDNTVTVLEFVLKGEEIPTNLLGVSLSFNAAGFGDDNKPINDDSEPIKDGMINSFEKLVTDITGLETIKDEIAPEMVTKEDKYDISWNTDGEIKIRYSENIDGAALSTLVFSVKGKTVEKVSANDDVVTIKVKDGLTEAPEITQKLEVYDKHGNGFKADKAFKAVKHELTEEEKAEEAKTEFLKKLETKVAEIKVADVEIDGENITVNFNAPAEGEEEQQGNAEFIRSVQTVAEEIFSNLAEEEVDEGTITFTIGEVEGESIKLKEATATDIARALLGGGFEKAQDFLENGNPIEASYVANLTKGEVKFKLNGNLKFAVADVKEVE